MNKHRRHIVESFVYAVVGCIVSMVIYINATSVVTGFRPTVLDAIWVQLFFLIWSLIKYYGVRRFFTWFWHR
jgi:hypothetical protein